MQQTQFKDSMSSISVWSSTSGSVFSSSFLPTDVKGKEGGEARWRRSPEMGERLRGRWKLIRDAANESQEPGSVYQLNPGAAERSAHSAPAALRIPPRLRSPCARWALFVPSRKRRRNGALPSTGTLRPPGKNSPVPGRRKVDVDWSSKRKAKRRKEGNRKEGLVTMFWKGRCLKIIRKGWPRAEDLRVSVLPHTTSYKSGRLQPVQLLNLV